MSHILALTQKYTLDMLNCMLFHRSLQWGGVDQYNELLILSGDDPGSSRTEQRAALLVHNVRLMALRIFVTVTDSSQVRVCYRILDLEEPTEIENKKYFPLEYTNIDFSIADNSLGVRQTSSGTFSYNPSGTQDEVRDKTFQLLRFMLDSSLIVVDNKDIFTDRVDDTLNFPPYPGDAHYKPIFEVVRQDA